ncbi:acyl-CoA thioesterase II [Pseudomonas sp. v388]|uniref:acyl-CoA thioesterase n=1 Tax=Pseudomonas sp. v388 TaxID=2479849 RepID=UPI000F7B3180|nr:acyl-CoA thioesterase II [Pseudomonas sp. v388]RRV10508.1 acyl-CoA thioesterase II [Pseudomonas sp. v388]
MSHALAELINIFNLETIEEGIFRAPSQELHLPQLFGGQVLGQAVAAASLTVECAKTIHSIHGYFIRRGRASKPVLYQVASLHDGRSFSTRQITASQDGKPIFTGSASFHIPEEGLSFQTVMPAVPEAFSLPLEIELLKGDEGLAQEVRTRSLAAQAIEIRPVEPIDPSTPVPREPLKRFWFKTAGQLPADQLLHRSVLAYASDVGLLITSLLPHGVSDLQSDMQVASLDHALWIHQDVKVDDWLLYSTESPWSGAGRGLARGAIYNTNGDLVAHVAQEGLTRKLKI